MRLRLVNTLSNTLLPDYIAGTVVLLMAFGTVFVFSAGANLQQEYGDLKRLYDFPSVRQILFFPLACLIIYLVARFDYKKLACTGSWWKTPVSYALAVSIILLVVVLIPRFGTEVNQARRWLRIPAGPVQISFQPSEFAKWAVIFFLAAYCDRFADSIKLFWKRLAVACVIVGVVVALIVLEDFGTAAFVSLLAFLLLFIGGAKWWHLLAPLPFAAAGFFLALVTSPERMQRIAAFLNPSKWADSAGYQASQSLIALGSGGLLGKGLGLGICKYGHLPEDTTDFIFAIIGEELGLAGTLFIILLFIVFLFLGALVVVRCRDRFGKLLAGAIVMAIGIQAALNIGVVTVVLPTKGIPLPFVSAGGTSMLLSAATIGVLLNIAKQTAAGLAPETAQ